MEAAFYTAFTVPWIVLFVAVFLYVFVFFRRWMMTRRRYVSNFQRSKVVVGPNAGVFSIQGRRNHMEDTYQAAVNLNGDPKKAFYGVFDGHGGHLASEYTAEYLHKLILKHKFAEQPVPSLKSGFKQLDHGWLRLAERNNLDDGSTVISVLIIDKTLFVANVGDSRAVLSVGGKALALSCDHKPNRDDEKKRIEKLGGRIVFFGTWRVEGVLAVTRAIGDRRLKAFVSAVPEITEHKLQVNDDFLILASDGVWDVLTCQDAVDIVKSAGDVRAGAKKLTETSFNRGSMDNITSLVIDLAPYRA